MTSIGRTARTGVRRFAVLLVVSLGLSACGPTHHALAPLTVDAVPSSTIATPLTATGCATQQCWAVGTTTVQGVTSTVAELRSLNGQWSPVTVPTVSGSFDASACLDTTCFFGGAADGHDLLWSASNDTGAVTPLESGDGSGIVALTCTTTQCLAVDRSAAGDARLVNLSDQTSTSIAAIAPTDTINALSCATATQCWVATTTTTGTAALWSTTDGTTWTPVAVPSWTTISSLSCAPTCLALVSDGHADSLARQTSTGWSTVPLPFAASALSCTTTQHCAIVGHHLDGSGAAILWRRDHVQPVILHYAPTPLTAVGCSDSDCVAVGATTLVSLRP